ncbi:MAG: TetR/AcrR family transcriptional regulator [Acidobacteria bacterium]|nr:TetR/AcrR family transcriptional regulator [Acidobacteriota bacterium]
MRSRKVSDGEILEAVQRAMQRRGPHELTLADIAAEAGVTPGLLVQRFGSKRDLLLALSEQFAGSAPAVFAALRAAHPAPLAALRAYAECMAGLASSPDALARNLAYLQIDLTDEAFRVHLLANARATRREIETLVRAAMSAGELDKRTDPRRLARTIETTTGGSLMSWACYREGPAAAWIRDDLDAVLEPYLTRRTATGGPTRPPARRSAPAAASGARRAPRWTSDRRPG